MIDARAWANLVVPSSAFAPRPLAKEVDSALSVPDADVEIRTGHYDIIQVSDGTVVTLYNWTHPAKGPIWCLATGNGYDVSHLKWMGGKTYAEIVNDLLAECPGFPAAAGLGFKREFLCEGDTRLVFKYLDRGRCYTIGFRHPNFHPMTTDPPGFWNIQTADLGTGTPRANSAGLPTVPHQTVYSLEDLAVLPQLHLPDGPRGRKGRYRRQVDASF